MAMLAERRRKTKFVLQPLSKPLWTTETSGKKMMEKMGWSAGKGLGAHEQGISEPVRAVFKQDTTGVGFKGDGNPFHNQDEFNAILANLAAANQVETEQAVTFECLEEKSKKSKTRVHYKKFTRGKDLSRYSTNDLACIVGNGKKEDEVEEESIEETYKPGETENAFGVTTVHGGSIADYFKVKWKTNRNENSCEPSEQSPGFGYNSELHASETPEEYSLGSKRREKKSKKGCSRDEDDDVRNGTISNSSAYSNILFVKSSKEDEQGSPVVQEEVCVKSSSGNLAMIAKQESERGISVETTTETNNEAFENNTKKKKRREKSEQNECDSTNDSTCLADLPKKKRKSKRDADGHEGENSHELLANTDRAKKKKKKRKENADEAMNCSLVDSSEEQVDKQNEDLVILLKNSVVEELNCAQDMREASDVKRGMKKKKLGKFVSVRTEEIEGELAPSSDSNDDIASNEIIRKNKKDKRREEPALIETQDEDLKSKTADRAPALVEGNERMQIKMKSGEHFNTIDKDEHQACSSESERTVAQDKAERRKKKRDRRMLESAENFSEVGIQQDNLDISNKEVSPKKKKRGILELDEKPQAYYEENQVESCAPSDSRVNRKRKEKKNKITDVEDLDTQDLAKGVEESQILIGIKESERQLEVDGLKNNPPVKESKKKRKKESDTGENNDVECAKEEDESVALKVAKKFHGSSLEKLPGYGVRT